MLSVCKQLKRGCSPINLKHHPCLSDNYAWYHVEVARGGSCMSNKMMRAVHCMACKVLGHAICIQLFSTSSFRLAKTDWGQVTRG